METALKTLQERYEIGEARGRKGPCLIFSGHDRTIGREVSVVRIDEEGPGGELVSSRDLVEDAIALASIQHSNFVAVYDFGKDEHGPYVITERLRGAVLEQTLEKGSLGPEDFIELVRQTLEALIAAHAAKLGPVRIEPWNVLLVRQPGMPFVAKVLGLGRDRRRPRQGQRKGGKGERPAGIEAREECEEHGAEFLAIGRLYYEALTGVRPFAETDTASLAGSPLLDELPFCHELNPEIPEELSDWIMWLICDADEDPETTAVSLLDEFLGLLGEKRRSGQIGRAGEGHEEGFDLLMNELEAASEAMENPGKGKGVTETLAARAPEFDRASSVSRELPGGEEEIDTSGGLPVFRAPGFAHSKLEGETEAVPMPETHELSAGRVPVDGLMLTPDDVAFLSDAANTLSELSSETPEEEELEISSSADEPATERIHVPLKKRAEPATERIRLPIHLRAEATAEDRELEAPPQEERIPDESEVVDVAPAMEEEEAADGGAEFETAGGKRPPLAITFALALGVVVCVLLIAIGKQLLAGGGRDRDEESTVTPPASTTSAVPGSGSARAAIPVEISAEAPEEVKAAPVVAAKLPETPASVAEETKGSPFAGGSRLATPEKAATAALAIAPGVNFGTDSAQSTDSTALGQHAAPVPGGLDEVLARAKQAELQNDDLAAFTDYLLAVEQFPRSETAREALVDYVGTLDSRPPDVIDFLEDKLVRSSEYGVASAMRILGERSYALEQWENAAEWFRKAALENDVRSKVFLGLLQVQGKGIAQNLREAAANFEWAAKRSDQNALYLAGECYVLGRGVTADPEKGLAYLDAAAEMGDLRALDLIGVCHARGLGTDVNFGEALSYFKTAAKNGHAGAMANLGVLYMNGQGVETDTAVAVEYFRAGAQVENAQCMYLYARCLEEGLGVEKDAEAAADWYRKAVMAGSSEAREWLAAKEAPVGG